MSTYTSSQPPSSKDIGLTNRERVREAVIILPRGQCAKLLEEIGDQ